MRNRLPNDVAFAQADARGEFDGGKDYCDFCDEQLNSGDKYIEIRDEKMCEQCIKSKMEVY